MHDGENDTAYELELMVAGDLLTQHKPGALRKGEALPNLPQTAGPVALAANKARFPLPAPTPKKPPEREEV